MARKSRKQNNQVTPVNIKPSILPAAAYIRLSVEDRDNKGNSIEMQRQMILRYIKENSDLELYNTYIDNGVSGTTFDRPAFSKMLEDIQNGFVRCIVVKDLSRLGRNSIDTGYYLEKYLPPLGIRFIAINDGYDTAENNYNTEIPLQNIMNEAYSYDIARKTKSQIHRAMHDGKYIGGRAPFGYRKAPHNRYQLIVDEPAAAIVKQIFEWAAEGKGVHEIVRLLNSKGVKSPGRYKYDQGIFSNEKLKGKGQWQARTVAWILSNETYVGNLVQGKTKVAAYKRLPASPDEWIRIENVHQAIISHEMFGAVQQIRNNRENGIKQKSSKAYLPNLLKGKIYCVHCRGRLDRKKSQQKYLYRCTSNRVLPGSCEGNSIYEDQLIETMEDLLIQYSELLSNSLPNLLVSKVDESELNWLEMQMLHTKDLIRSLYENLASGLITSKEYQELRSEYQKKIEQQRKRYSELMWTLAEQEVEKSNMQELIQILEAFKNSHKLTKELVDKLVNKIEVYKDGRIHVRFLHTELL